MSRLVTSVKATGVQDVSIRYDDGEGFFDIVIDGSASMPFWIHTAVDAELGRKSIVARQVLRNLRDDINKILGDD